MAEVRGEGPLDQGVGPVAVGLVVGAVPQGESGRKGRRRVGGRGQGAGHDLVAADGAVAAPGEEAEVEGGLHVELESQYALTGGQLPGPGLHAFQQ